MRSRAFWLCGSRQYRWVQYILRADGSGAIPYMSSGRALSRANFRRGQIVHVKCMSLALAMLISATGIQSVVTSHALFNTRTTMDPALSQTPIIVYAHTLCVKRGRLCRTDPLLSLLIHSSSHSILIALDHPSRHASLNRDRQDQSTQGVITANHAGWWTGQDPCRPAKTF